MGEQEVADDAAAAALIASSSPRSFRMNRRSPEGERLKAAVSRKLVDFLANYTDDVLAEYIVVLVCNGKRQNQVRDDLEAFLGDDSENFVAWLWHYLSKESSFHVVSAGVSSQKSDAIQPSTGQIGTEQKSEPMTESQMLSSMAADIPLFKDGKAGCSDSSSVPYSFGLEASGEISRIGEGLVVQNNEFQGRKYRTNRSDDSMAFKISSTHSFEASVGCERSLQFEGSYQKASVGMSIDIPVETPQQEPNRRNLMSAIAEHSHLNHQSLPKTTGRRLSPEARSSVLHQSIHQRASVWDRLGKRYEDSDTLMDVKKNQDNVDVSKIYKMDHCNKGVDKLKCTPFMSAALGKRVVQDTKPVENFHGSSISSNAAVKNTGFVKKRLILGDKGHINGMVSSSACINDRLEDKGSYNELQRPSSAERINKESLKQAGMNLSSPPNQISGSFDKSEQSKAKLLRNPQHAAAGDNPIETEVLDVMKRLSQIEREMLELRSKQTKMNADAKVLASQGASLSSFLEDDADARTVFVTNVHFSAPKEALSSHFTQCGPIVRLISPVNTVAGQQPGSAYITFSNKESAEKAISLNGTTFFSRTLKVARKSDVRVGTIAPKQAAGKPQKHADGRTRQASNSGFLGKDSSQKHLSGHLQWRREQAPGGDSPAPASATLPSHFAAKGVSQRRRLSPHLQWRRGKAAAGGDEPASHAEQ